MSEYQPQPEVPLTTEQRYQLAATRVLEIYSQCLQDGRYDMAWNKLSPALYNMRSLSFQIEQEQLADEQRS